MKSAEKICTGFFLVCMLTLSLVVISGCDKDDDEPDNAPSIPDNEVWMQNTAFTPSSRTVSVGTTITWRNKDNIVHTVTSNTGNFTSSGNLGNGGTHNFQFTQAGTYAYHCTPHPQMTGTIVVQ